MGKERVEEKETGVMIEDVEALLEEVDAMSMKFSLSWKTLTKRKQKANFYHTILRKKSSTPNTSPIQTTESMFERRSDGIVRLTF